MSNNAVDLFGRLQQRRRKPHGFTLLELLLVIAIILLLVSILIPVISKARESAKRTICINNLGQIAKAVLAYVSDNDGAFPYAAAQQSATGTGHQPGDWISWQSTPSTPPRKPGELWIDQVDIGGIGKYLNCNDLLPGGLAVLRCPSDARLSGTGLLDFSPGETTPSRPYPTGPTGQPIYPFSYVLNALMSSGNSTASSLAPDGKTPLSLARTLARVKDQGGKILVYEEDPRMIDDGCGLLMPNPLNQGTMTELISLRHEMPELDNPNASDPSNAPDPMNAPVKGGTPPTFDNQNWPNAGKAGNAAFCDGHAEAVTRTNAHKQYWAPIRRCRPWPDILDQFPPRI